MSLFFMCLPIALMLAILMLALALFGGRRQSPVAPGASSEIGEFGDFSDDDFRTAALSILRDRPHCRDSFFGGTVAECQGALARCEAMRKEYADTQPLRLRKAIERWIDYFEREASENLADVISGRKRREHKEWWAREVSQMTRARELAAALQRTKGAEGPMTDPPANREAWSCRIVAETVAPRDGRARWEVRRFDGSLAFVVVGYPCQTPIEELVRDANAGAAARLARSHVR